MPTSVEKKIEQEMLFKTYIQGLIQTKALPKDVCVYMYTIDLRSPGKAESFSYSEPNFPLHLKNTISLKAHTDPLETRKNIALPLYGTSVFKDRIVSISYHKNEYPIAFPKSYLGETTLLSAYVGMLLFNSSLVAFNHGGIYEETIRKFEDALYIINLGQSVDFRALRLVVGL